MLALPVPVLRRAGIMHENATRLLAHLFQHQIHHRGQAHAMLAGTPVKPPQLDEFFCANEAHLRAAELAELGLSEAAIWGEPSAPMSRVALARSAMLWACLLLPSLPLDVFARAALAR